MGCPSSLVTWGRVHPISAAGNTPYAGLREYTSSTLWNLSVSRRVPFQTCLLASPF